jgi:sigma-B regulation protein RsbQ
LKGFIVAAIMAVVVTCHSSVQISMSIQIRNNVNLAGEGPATVIFAHGFGCDQTMWRSLAPAFAQRFRTISFDLVGSGDSDRNAYDRARYATLHGYAADLLEIIDGFATGPVIHIGHSVSATVGMLAAIEAPHKFAAQVMIGPSPSYLNDGDYVGGFNREDLDELMALMDDRFDDWANYLAPAIMGAPDRPELGHDLARSFCRNDPAIARHFARVCFLSDHRADLCKSSVPALVLQCSDDLIAPRDVGAYVARHLPNSILQIIDNVGHCPHISAPSESAQAIEAFLVKALR